MTPRQSDLPHVESISRISKLPIVEDGMQIAGSVYTRIKRSNSLINWGLGTAERSLVMATAIATPAINVFVGPITTIDHLLCKGIDVVEDKVPAVRLTPRQMYINAKDYMTSKIEPVLSHSISLAHIGSKSNTTVESYKDALNYLKKRMDEYMPAELKDEVDCVVANKDVDNTVLTIMQSERCIVKLIKVLIHMGKNFLVTLIRMLTHPGNTLHEILDLLRNYVFPTDKREADAPAVAFEMFLENVIAFVRIKVQEIFATLTPLFRARCELMTVRLKIYNAVQEYLTLLAAYLVNVFVWLMYLVKIGVWRIHDHLCEKIRLCLESIIILTGSVPKTIMRLLEIDYNVKTEGDRMNIKIAAWLMKTIRNFLTWITKALVGERYVPKPLEVRNHHRNGIEH